MYPTMSYELTKAQMADLRHQARHDARARAARRARRKPARLTEDDAQRHALFASSLQQSDALGPVAHLTPNAITAVSWPEAVDSSGEIGPCDAQRRKSGVIGNN
jgi:hypothetical protein